MHSFFFKGPSAARNAFEIIHGEYANVYLGARRLIVERALFYCRLIQPNRNYRGLNDPFCVGLPEATAEEAYEYVKKISGLNISYNFFTGMLALYPIQVSVMNSKDLNAPIGMKNSDAELFLREIISSYFLDCPWPQYQDEITDDEWRQVLAKAYQVFTDVCELQQGFDQTQ